MSNKTIYIDIEEIDAIIYCKERKCFAKTSSLDGYPSKFKIRLVIRNGKTIADRTSDHYGILEINDILDLFRKELDGIDLTKEKIYLCEEEIHLERFGTGQYGIRRE